MPIRPHGKGWEVRVQHAYGRVSKTFGHYRDAQEFERSVQARVRDNRVGRTPRYSLNEAIEKWLSVEAASLKSHRNLKDKARMLYPYTKGRMLDEIVQVSDEVKAAGLKRGVRSKKPLTPATINRRLAILRRVARLAHRKWDPPWLDRDLGVKITLLGGEEARTEQATPNQVKTLMLAAPPRVRKAIVWASLTGLRSGELRRVGPESFVGRSIVVMRNKTGKPRIVPLAGGLDPKAFPFELTHNEVEKDFRAARAAAGMPWLQFRDLRRTCGSWIVQRTGSLKAAQDILGHTTIAVTAKHYAHLLTGHLKAAVATLPNLAGQARGRRAAKK